ncbi:MAG TPA: hypothetical protein VN598_13340 [Usitatibacter sp.]|nr:hypothetical protein [Usitatibacter sp.]
MKALIRSLALVLGLALAGPSHATFHLWRTDQVYSNADGTIQYIVLVALSNGQEFISGHTIQVTQGSTVHTFTFNQNLPGDTATGGGGAYGEGTMFKTLLLGTQGFANLHVVQPDFIIPDGFLFTSNASINWGGGWDIFNYGALPMDGTNALFRAGNVAFNAPQNFAGVMGNIEAGGPFNVQGLWWRSPAGSESGWGVNITHQANTLFATWFTYDTDGSGMWLVLANGAQSAGNPNSYAGDLFRTTGPAFNTANWVNGNVVATKVGNATFTFSDKDTGTFAYTVNGVTQSKPIMREVFGTSVPTCVESGSPSTSNYQDLWWHSPANSESGWGINITQQGAVIFATWFTYDTTGKGQWIVMAQGVQGTGSASNSWTGDLFKTVGPAFSSATFDPNAVHATMVGTGTFTFTDASNGTFTYTLNGTAGSKAIMRESFATPASVCN